MTAAPTMSVAKAKFVLRSEFERIHRERGPQAAGDFAKAMETLINDAVKQVMTAQANQ